MKKKSTTRKGTATENQKKFNPLSSENWISESSMQYASLRAAADPLPSPSDDPCKDCHVDFFEEEVTVEWGEAPDNTYQAAENVDTSGGGWTPDLWSLSPTSSGASIDEDTGEVTFGSEGCSVKITARVRRCQNYKKSFKADIVQVQIFDGKIDVTGKPTDRQVGELIDLEARIIPADLLPGGDPFEWKIPDKVLHKYEQSEMANPKVPQTPDALRKQNVTYFWLEGGKNKIVALSVTIKGLPITVKTTYNISRPTAKIIVSSKKDPHFIRDPDKVGNNRAWRMQASILFKRDSFNGGNGKTYWAQIVTAKYTYDGIPVDDGTGLDNHFPYPEGTQTEAPDDPGTGEKDKNGFSTVTMDYSFSMYLMFLSSRPGSSFVPLRRYDWKVSGKAVIVGKPNVPPANYKVTGKTIPAPNDADETEPPTWTKIIKNK